MPEYEWGVQWEKSEDVVFSGNERTSRDVLESLSESVTVLGFHADKPVLIRRPKGDWEKVQ